MGMVVSVRGVVLWAGLAVELAVGFGWSWRGSWVTGVVWKGMAVEVVVLSVVKLGVRQGRWGCGGVVCVAVVVVCWLAVVGLVLGLLWGGS